jgi:hypothetical protein
MDRRLKGGKKKKEDRSSLLINVCDSPHVFDDPLAYYYKYICWILQIIKSKCYIYIWFSNIVTTVRENVWFSGLGVLAPCIYI